MKKNYFSLLFLISFALFDPCFSQQTKLDSTILYLQTAKEDTNKVKALNYAGSHTGFEAGMKYLDEGFKLSKKLNYKLGTIHILSSTSSQLETRSDFNSSLKYSIQAAKIAEEFGNTRIIFEMYGQIFNACAHLGNYPLAMETNLKGLKLAEKLNNKKLIAKHYILFGFIYGQQNNIEKVKEYYLKYLKIAEELKSEEMLAVAYLGLTDISQSEGKLTESIDYQFKALSLYEKIYARDKNPGHNVRQQMVSIYNNLASLYKETGDLKKALYFSDKCLKNCALIMNGSVSGINLYDLSTYYNTNGEIYIELKDFKQAELSLNKDLDISIRSAHKENTKRAYYSLSRLYSKQNDFKKAYLFHKKYSDLKDTLLNEESSKQVAEMNTKYESEKKDKELLKKDAEINKQEAEARHQSVLRNSFIIGFILVVFLALFILRSYHQKRQDTMAIQKQKELIEEKNKEITDSIHYAKRIQTALIPSEKYIDKTLTKLIKGVRSENNA